MCSTCSKISQGIHGLCKALAGIDRAPMAVINERRAACAECPSVTSLLGARFCQCGCLIVAKTAIAAEECPLPGDAKKWSKFEEAPEILAAIRAAVG